MKSRPTPRIALGPALQSYFYSYLIGQRDVSPRTIRSYRDTFRLLLRFLQQQGMPPEKLCVDDLDADRILAFLADLEKSRRNCARSRNARFAAIRSFLRHATAANPLLLPVTQRVLAIPMKRFDRVAVGYLTRDQMQAVLDSPNMATTAGQRDQLLLVLLYNTGARVSEIVDLKVKDVRLESHSSVHLIGKGRKQPPLSSCHSRLQEASG
jgi:site-specific recombinase XerD